MNLFDIFKKSESKEMPKRFVEMIQKNNKLQEENEILYKSLSLSCFEIYKHTGNFDTNPEYFINKIKNRYGIIE